jgi:hypothetical protein
MLIKKKILFLYPFLFFALTGCGNEGSFKNGVSDSAPTAYDASAATLINSSIDIILNGTDPENRPLTYRIIEGPARGTLTRKEYNIYRYSPENNYEGHDNFTFRVNDGKNDSNTGRVATHAAFRTAPRGL